MVREEAMLWFRQALAELRAARNALKAGDWFASVFWCHQACEKALNALLLGYGKAVRGHDLLRLARCVQEELGLELPRTVLRCLRRLNPHYVVSRYPDAANGLPFEVYEREDAEEALKCCEEVIRWVEQYLH